MSRVHAGLWVDCKNCNPDWEPKKKDRKDVKPKYTSGDVSVDIAIRRQIAFDLGDEEPNKDEKFALLQKYGAAAPRIDRNVSKPDWQEEGVWKSQKGQWDKIVKGLVPRSQSRVILDRNGKPLARTFNPRNSSRQSRPNNSTRTGTPRT